MKVYIVTDSDLGWDNIIGAFTNKAAAEKCKETRGDTGTVHTVNLEKKFEDE